MESLMPILGVTFKGISSGWGIVALSLALENGQKKAILSMSYVFYILVSFANLISLAKLNNIRLYWDNKTWNLYNTKRSNHVVDYISKWYQNWVFQLWDMDIKDITVDITRFDADTYQWSIDNTLSILSITQSKSKKLSVWHSRLARFNFITFHKYF